MTNFRNKTVWVTGASSGIGEALAYKFARLGAKLVLSARNETELKRVAAACGGTAHVVPLDLAEYRSMEAIVRQVLHKAGKVDILVNNAGVSQRSLVKDTDLDVLKKLIDVNLLGTIALSKALLPHFLARQEGHFVVITSLTGKIGSPKRSAYAAAKHGLHGFFDSLRAEVWKDHILVTLVCPGFVRTNVSINALTADGSKQNSMDEKTGEGMAPEVLAEKIVRAVARQKEEVYIGGMEVIGIYLKRLFPGIFSRIIRKAKVT